MLAKLVSCFFDFVCLSIELFLSLRFPLHALYLSFLPTTAKCWPGYSFKRSHALTLVVLALNLCWLTPLLVGNFRFRAIDAPCGSLNDAPEFTANVMGSVTTIGSSSDSLSWLLASIFTDISPFENNAFTTQLKTGRQKFGETPNVTSQ